MLRSDVCIVCVFTEAQGEATITGDEGFLSVGATAMADKVIMDHGTVSPMHSQRMDKAVSGMGGGYLDAPISGGPEGAMNGTLSVMVGGEGKHLETCRPLLESTASRVEHMGGTGAGAATKLVNQHLVIANTVAACEACVLAQRFGLRDTAKLKGLLEASWGHSRMLDKILTDLIRMEEDGEGALLDSMAPLRTLAKDAQIITKAVAQSGIRLPLFPAAQGQVDEAIHRGLSSCEFAALTSVIDGKGL
ncbi:unnamed protein product [Discosporangium mesarthrocarpum]